MDIELKYTWSASRRSWYIRLFKWVYETSDKDVTFCKLFWGYVFMWLALPPTLIVKSVRAGFNALPEPESKEYVSECSYCRRHKPHTRHYFSKCNCSLGQEGAGKGLDHRSRCNLTVREYKLVYDNDQLVKYVPPSLGLRGINKVANGFIRLGMWGRNPRVRTALKILGYAGLTLVAVSTLFLAGLGFVNAVKLITHIPHQIILPAVSGLFIIVVTVLTALYTGALVLMIRWALSPVKASGKFVGYGGKRAGLGFFRMMKLGYIAVKTNTCPKIEITDD